MSEDNKPIVELPECGMDDLIGLVKFNSARQWVSKNLNMDIRMIFTLSKDGYIYVVVLRVNRHTPTWIKVLLEDEKHEGIYHDIVGSSYTLVDAIDRMKAEIKAKGLIK